jgi:beta-galactosidase
LPAGPGVIWAEPLDLLPSAAASAPSRAEKRREATDFGLPAPDGATHAELVFRNPGGWLDGRPAMVTRPLGLGSISYLGAVPAPDLLAALLDRAVVGAHVSPARLSTLPAQVELCVRSAPDRSREVDILINHANTPISFRIGGRYQSVLEGPTITATTIPTGIPASEITLPAQGIAVLTPEETR